MECELTFCQGGFCYLYAMPSLTGKKEDVPGVAGTYGREDEQGRRIVYIADGDESRGYKVMLGARMSPVYGDRMFIYGRDGSDSLPMDILREKIKTLGLREPFDELLTWRGYSKGKLTFDQTLMGEVNLGIRWWELEHRLRSPLPEGWELYRPLGCRYLTIYAK